MTRGQGQGASRLDALLSSHLHMLTVFGNRAKSSKLAQYNSFRNWYSPLIVSSNLRYVYFIAFCANLLDGGLIYIQVICVEASDLKVVVTRKEQTELVQPLLTQEHFCISNKCASDHNAFRCLCMLM